MPFVVTLMLLRYPLHSLLAPSQQNSFLKMRRNSLCYEALWKIFSIGIEVGVPYYWSSDPFLSHFYAAKVPTAFTFWHFHNKTLFNFF
jgi:hypothetical protein